MKTGRLWLGSIIAALLAALGLFVMMLQMEKNMLAQYDKGIIFVSNQEIPKGELIHEKNYQNYFVEREVEKSCIPSNAIQNVEQIKNLVTGYDMDKGTLLTQGMFESQDQITKGMKEPVIASFRVDDLYQMAGGILRTGDRVHIYCVDEEGNTSLVWSDVYVLQTFDSYGTEISTTAKEAAMRANIFLEKENIESFYTHLAQGSLRVVKVCS